MMKWYTEFSIETDIVTAENKKAKTTYCDNIFTLDVETSTAFDIDGNGILKPFDHNIPYERYTEIAHFNVLYIWQMSIDGVVYYGRTLEQLKFFLECLHTVYNDTIIIYVHNLAYEFQYLRDILDFSEVFARTPHKPMYARCDDLALEFRCSYFLTNMKLESIPHAFGTPTQKLVGDLDYTIIHTPNTPLTEQEKAYCENDCLILHELIDYYKKIYKHIYKIPTTATSIVRKQVNAVMWKHRTERGKVQRNYPNLQIFLQLQKAFQGGYTHANSHKSGKIFHNVISMDRASSYPAVMVTKKYPCGTFRPVDITDISELSHHNAYLLQVGFRNIMCKGDWTYLSKSKALKLQCAEYDNGRVICAEYCEYIITDVDLQIILENYDVDNEDIYVIKAYASPYQYLPKCFVETILDYYGKKTSLKNVAGYETEYRTAKANINSLYGMAVTNTVRPDVLFNNNEWSVDEISIDIIAEKLAETRDKAFLNYAWGIWITAHARRELWRMISIIDKDAIYSDTDSIKYMGDYEADFIANNERIIDELHQVADDRNIPFEAFAPKDPKGTPHPLGVFEVDGVYKDFITLGAKKYAYNTDDGELHTVVSGVSTKSGAQCLKDISNFKPDFVFDTKSSGRLIMYYDSNQADVDFVDYLGNAYHCTQKHTISAQPTSYKLGITDEYSVLISVLSSETSTHIDYNKII